MITVWIQASLSVVVNKVNSTGPYLHELVPHFLLFNINFLLHQMTSSAEMNDELAQVIHIQLNIYDLINQRDTLYKYPIFSLSVPDLVVPRSLNN